MVKDSNFLFGAYSTPDLLGISDPILSLLSVKSFFCHIVVDLDLGFSKSTPMHFAWGHWGAYAICKVFHYRFLDSIKGTVDDHFFGLQNLQKWWRWSTSITIAELSTSPGQKEG